MKCSAGSARETESGRWRAPSMYERSRSLYIKASRRRYTPPPFRPTSSSSSSSGRRPPASALPTHRNRHATRKTGARGTIKTAREQTARLQRRAVHARGWEDREGCEHKHVSTRPASHPSPNVAPTRNAPKTKPPLRCQPATAALDSTPMPPPQKTPQSDNRRIDYGRTASGARILVPATPAFTVFRDETAGPALPTVAQPPLTPMFINDTFDLVTPPPATQPPTRSPLEERAVNVVEGESARRRAMPAMAGAIPAAEMREALVSRALTLSLSL